jgi:hypothetical protein
MEKMKIVTNYQTKHLESMIEYMLVISILEKICEMTKKIVGISKRCSQNQNMGNKIK